MTRPATPHTPPHHGTGTDGPGRGNARPADAAFLGSLATFAGGVVAMMLALWPPAPQAHAQTQPPALSAAPLAAPRDPAARPAALAIANPPAGAARAWPRFGPGPASADARLVARWAFQSGDHGGRAVVLVDKPQARVFVFHPDGTLRGASPALVGSAVGDHTVPGVGDKPIAQVLPSERTTPAGRFVAEMGVNAQGEDVVWVDYDAAVSMHRVRPTVKAERRLERLASHTVADNRITYGCINLPVAFYEKVLSPTVRTSGAVVYVLPETRTAAALFGAHEVPERVELAAHAAAAQSAAR
ncbi:hypothetical protein [Paracidovorax sp. MALMAid1276]|uniref:hypothetical protein n=1 Tax=Paracidovorax sp. MALMAid1276 TaxID=3411631 RepID=UPI003B9955D8